MPIGRCLHGRIRINCEDVDNFTWAAPERKNGAAAFTLAAQVIYAVAAGGWREAGRGARDLHAHRNTDTFACECEIVLWRGSCWVKLFLADCLNWGQLVKLPAVLLFPSSSHLHPETSNLWTERCFLHSGGSVSVTVLTGAHAEHLHLWKWLWVAINMWSSYNRDSRSAIVHPPHCMTALIYLILFHSQGGQGSWIYWSFSFGRCRSRLNALLDTLWVRIDGSRYESGMCRDSLSVLISVLIIALPPRPH